MKIKRWLFCTALLTLFLCCQFDKSECKTKRSAREEIQQPSDTDTLFDSDKNAMKMRDRARRETYPFGDYYASDDNEENSIKQYEYGDEYEPDETDDFDIDRQDTSSQDERDENIYENIDEIETNFGNYDYEDEDGLDDYEFDDYEQDSFDEYDVENMEDDYESDEEWGENYGENEFTQNEIEYDEYESDEGQTAEDTELWYRKRRSAEDESVVCDSEEERHLTKRINSLQESLTVLQKELDYEQNKCKTVDSTTLSTEAPTSRKYTVSHTMANKNGHKHHKKIDDLPMCEI